VLLLKSHIPISSATSSITSSFFESRLDPYFCYLFDPREPILSGGPTYALVDLETSKTTFFSHRDPDNSLFSGLLPFDHQNRIHGILKELQVEEILVLGSEHQGTLSPIHDWEWLQQEFE